MTIIHDPTNGHNDDTPASIADAIDALLLSGRIAELYTIPDADCEPPSEFAHIFTPLGRCATHDRVWLETSSGKAHPQKGTPFWCWLGETPAEVEVRRQLRHEATTDQLRRHLRSVGWDWDTFCHKVLRATWEEWANGGGSVPSGWFRFQQHTELLPSLPKRTRRKANAPAGR